MEYRTVSEFGTDSFIEKKSKFIGYCLPVQTEEDAQTFIKEIKQKHKDATHNVWAYSLKNGSVFRYSDDGEPQGSAGIPVLDVLRKSNTLDAVIVATRYFGGILLGGGGLVRAYSHTASVAMTSAKPVIMKECVLATICLDYTYLAKVQEYCQIGNIIIDDIIYEDKVKLNIHALESDLLKLKKQYTELTNGKSEITEIDRGFYSFPIESE